MILVVPAVAGIIGGQSWGHWISYIAGGFAFLFGTLAILEGLPPTHRFTNAEEVAPFDCEECGIFADPETISEIRSTAPKASVKQWKAIPHFAVLPTHLVPDDIVRYELTESLQHTIALLHSRSTLVSEQADRILSMEDNLAALQTEIDALRSSLSKAVSDKASLEEALKKSRASARQLAFPSRESELEWLTNRLSELQGQTDLASAQVAQKPLL